MLDMEGLYSGSDPKECVVSFLGLAKNVDSGSKSMSDWLTTAPDSARNKKPLWLPPAILPDILIQMKLYVLCVCT